VRGGGGRKGLREEGDEEKEGGMEEGREGDRGEGWEEENIKDTLCIER